MAAKIKVAILGSTGMLGSMVRRVLAAEPEYEVLTLDRGNMFGVERVSVDDLVRFLSGCNYAINCIGQIKPRIDEFSSDSVECAIRVNTLFPYRLARAAERTGCRVLQIATDCVFSGTTGGYTESSPHDALDVYGKTKSLGEVRFLNVHHLRCSIIGPELAGRKKDSLLEWFLSHPRNATIKGFVDHRWNGITTLHFAKLCHGIMSQRIDLSYMQHVVPDGTTNKATLLQRFAKSYQREDIVIDSVLSTSVMRRDLATEYPEKTRELWRAAGYVIPSIQQMIEELVAYK